MQGASGQRETFSAPLSLESCAYSRPYVVISDGEDVQIVRIQNVPQRLPGLPFSVNGIVLFPFQLADFAWTQLDLPPWEGRKFGWVLASGPVWMSPEEIWDDEDDS